MKTDYTPMNLCSAELESFLLLLSQDCHQWCRAAGFYDDFEGTVKDIAIKAALIAAEGIELFEAARANPIAPCDKNPALTCEQEEVADIFLRLLDYCGWRGINLLEAARTKHETNVQRARAGWGKNF